MMTEQEDVKPKTPRSLPVSEVHYWGDKARDQLLVWRRRMAGVGDNGESQLTTKTEEHQSMYESYILQEAATIDVLLDCCENPDAPVLRELAELVENVRDVYGIDRLDAAYGVVYARNAELADVTLPPMKKRSRKKPQPVLRLATIGVYDHDVAEDPQGYGTVRDHYSLASPLFEVPLKELSVIPRPASLVVTNDGQRYKLNVDASLHVSREGWEQDRKLKDKVESLEDALMAGLSKVQSDRASQFYIQNVVKGLLEKK